MDETHKIVGIILSRDYDVVYVEHSPGKGSYIVESSVSGRLVWGPGTYSECAAWIAKREGKS